MKKFSRILIAIAGAPVVLLLWAFSLLRRPRYADCAEVVVLYSQVIWDEVWQRPQQYAWLTSRQVPVIYCCPVQLHNLLILGKRWKPVQVFEKGGQRLVVLSPLVFSGHFKSHWIHRLNSRIVASHLRQATPKNARVYFLTNTPYGLTVLQDTLYAGGRRLPQLHRLVYDVIDDFTVFDWSPAFGKSHDALLMQMADSVIAGTHELADSRPNTVFIPCGVDFDLFATAQPAPPEVAGLPRPILGYFGTISERVDMAIIAGLADRFPEGSVVMVGPVHLPLSVLPQRANIHWLGLKRHHELPAYAQAFDVALIPFRITDATVKLNPVKTLEYLAAGLPVVATRLPDLEKFYHHIVHIADSAEEFAEEVENLLHQPNHGRIQKGVETAKETSWNSMVEKINEALQLTVPPATHPQAGTPDGETPRP